MAAMTEIAPADVYKPRSFWRHPVDWLHTGPLAFGLFPNWMWWQDVRFWLYVDLLPAVRVAWRVVRSAFRTFPR